MLTAQLASFALIQYRTQIPEMVNCPLLGQVFPQDSISQTCPQGNLIQTVLLWSTGLCSEISADKSGEPTRKSITKKVCQDERRQEYCLLKSDCSCCKSLAKPQHSPLSETHLKSFRSALINYWAQFYPCTGILGDFSPMLWNPGEKVGHTVKNLLFPQSNLCSIS